MKNSIGKQASLGVEDPVALGLLCEGNSFSLHMKLPNSSNIIYSGFVCSLIKMTLVEEGVYLPVTIRKFRVPELQSDLLSLPKTMECLNLVLVYINAYN